MLSILFNDVCFLVIGCGKKSEITFVIVKLSFSPEARNSLVGCFTLGLFTNFVYLFTFGKAFCKTITYKQVGSRELMVVP